MQWDFWSLNPESLHQVTILFSDRGLPASYRHMNGYGSHTLSFVNTAGERFWCKFHFKTSQGIKNLTGEDSANLIGIDRESHHRDLFEAIQRGEYPSWTVKVQVMTEEQAKTFQWNPFDLTKVWPHNEYPLMEIGILELNRNPENYFAEVEQAAFSPSVFVPGIGPSPDKVLQARLMSYPDAQRYRIGTNYQQLPVNQPRCPVMHYQGDGAMSTGYGGSSPNYYPNSDSNAPKEAPQYREPGLSLGDVVADRYESRDQDDYTQAGNFWRIFSEDEKNRTAQAIAGALSGARQDIQMRQLCHFFRADMDYGRRVAQALNIEIDPAILQQNNPQPVTA
jgi:catalase